MLDYQYAYLFLNVCLFPFWFFLYIYRKDLRHKILWMSFLIGLAGPISEFWYLQDYWNPLTITRTAVGIEDYLFGFFIGGIGSVIYEEVFGKTISKRCTKKHHWALFFVLITGICFVISNFLFFYYRINSIYTSFLAFIIVAFFMLCYRKDLWKDAVISGIFCGLILLVSYLLLLLIYPHLFIKMWHLHNLSGIYIVNVPIEEILWAFGWGMVAGPLYEFYCSIFIKRYRGK